MNKRDRVLTTLDHKEPDMVPITELAIDPPLIERILGETTTNEPSNRTLADRRKRDASVVNATVHAYMKLGFEMIACEPSTPDSWISNRNHDGTVNDEWGRTLSYDPNANVWIQTGSMFKSMEEFEHFDFPDPHTAGRTFAIERMKTEIGDELALAGLIRDSFVYAWEMFRITDFVRWLYEKPDFIKRLVERITDFNVEVTKQMIDAGADVFFGDGDYCEKRGPLVPLKFFKDVIFPNLQRQVAVVHRAGLKFIKHTDGNVNPIISDLANIVDGLHSLDPTAGIDIGEVKRVYGDRLVLMGNVSVDNLCTKSPPDIIEETKKCLRSAASGGGFILSSSNSWYASAKIENCLAMVDTGRKYGRYPVEIK
jgi:uroporphyrinogen-III decarboxylase